MSFNRTLNDYYTFFNNQLKEQRMQCPFLKKIQFKKIKQIVSEDSNQQQLINLSSNLVSTQQDFDQIESTLQRINSSDSNKHNIYYFNTKINIPQKSYRHLEIKFPKQFQTKKMMVIEENTGYDALSEKQSKRDIVEYSTNQDIFAEPSHEEMKNIPQILISKMSMMNSKCQDCFYGEVTLSDNIKYICSIKDQIIRISKDKKVKYFIQLRKIKCNYQLLKPTIISLSAKTNSYQIKFTITFDNPQKTSTFCKALDISMVRIKEELQIDQKIVNQSLSLDYSLDSLKFQTERMDIQKLMQIGDTFDLILFKNKNFMSKFQRFFTNSDYDHVAMLLKTSNSEHFILQSTCNNGVSVYALKSLIDLPRKKYYNRIGYRKYNGERSYQILLILQNFIKEAVGKKYKFDPMYLISSQVQKEDTFFCSQLVSEALKKVGFLSKQKPSYKYLPKHFSDESINQDLQKGHYSDITILQ